MLVVFVGGPKDGLMREVHDPGVVLWIDLREYEHNIAREKRDRHVPYRRAEHRGDRVLYIYAGHSETQCEGCGCFHVRVASGTCTLCGGSLAAP